MIVMNKEQILKSVLTVGCGYNPPRGGIAHVIYYYDKYIYNKFKFLRVSDRTNRFNNFFIFIYSLLKYFFLLLFDRNIKIIHIHTASSISFVRSTLFLRIGHFFKKKVIMHIHGGGFRNYYFGHKKFVEKNLQRCDYVFTLSVEWLHFYRTLGLKRIKIIENIIPYPEYFQIKTSNDRLHILFIGLIHERKGVFDLLEMLRDHSSYYKDKIYLHIGGNGETQLLKERIKKFGLSSFVKFEGWVDEDKKVELMNLCKVLVLPSYVEGLPLSILEAMSYNMAIVSTRVGGIPSAVKHNKNGLLIQPGYTSELHNSLKMLVEDEELLNSMCQKSTESIERFYPMNVEKKLFRIYKSLLLQK